VVNQGKLESCGGESICPVGAIEKINAGKEPETENPSQSTPTTNQPFASPGRGQRVGRGMGEGGRR